MKKIILILILSIATNLMAQDNTWHAFFAEDGYTRGFKNEKGEVMIPPKFMGFTWAKKFKNIIAVMEGTDLNSAYYLLKNGTKVGKDSLYIWDMATDCESEGMIRFRDQKTDKVGFFDSKGKVAIPALYAEALPFYNGVAVVYDGERVCEDGTIYTKNKPCEHWMLSENTNTLLIDRKHNILIDDFKYSNLIDLYSIKKNDTTALPYRLTQVGTNNNYYSFNNYEKQFENWLEELINKIETRKHQAKKELLPLESLIHESMPIIYVRNTEVIGSMRKVKSKPFIESNSKYLTATFIALQNEDADFFISLSGLDPYIWHEPDYEKYFDDCGEALETKHPVLAIIINKKEGGKNYQEIFKFLKTEEGFKLISVESSKVKIK